MDEILFELIEFLKTQGIKPSAFIRYIHTEGRRHFSKELHGVYESFASATKSELWESKDALLDYMKSADRTEEDIRAGKMGGYNVIFWHRAKVLTSLVDEVIEAAFKAAADLLPSGVLNANAEYLAQLKRYMALRKRNVFNFHAVDKQRFDYDFVKLDESAFLDAPTRLSDPIEIEFFHTDEQKALFGSFNTGVTGAARTMAKLCMPRMYRTMRSDSLAEYSPAADVMTQATP
jgi:hypothetical protein